MLYFIEYCMYCWPVVYLEPIWHDYATHRTYRYQISHVVFPLLRLNVWIASKANKPWFVANGIISEFLVGFRLHISIVTFALRRIPRIIIVCIFLLQVHHNGSSSLWHIARILWSESSASWSLSTTTSLALCSLTRISYLLWSDHLVDLNRRVCGVSVFCEHLTLIHIQIPTRLRLISFCYSYTRFDATGMQGADKGGISWRR